jgi:monovalent cation:H+ antiporter, CPA1 family
VSSEAVAVRVPGGVAHATLRPMETTDVLTVELFVLLVLVATIVAVVAKRIALPYTIALVLAGLAIAVFARRDRIEVTPELILAVLIPGLVFEAAYKLDITELRRGFGIVAVLAAPGVLITAAIVAVVVSTATGLDFGLAFLLGAIVSATDPVAVVSLFKRLGAPKRLATLVDAESLFNDGTGVVLFAIALTALKQPVTAIDGLVSFVLTVAVSTVIGIVAGYLAFRAMRATDDPQLEVAISVVAAYGTYLLADRLHESGIIATVVVGLVLGLRPSMGDLSEQSRAALDTVWEFVAFLLTALTFLLVGFAISIELLIDALPVIGAGFVAITVARAIVVFGLIGGGSRLLPESRRLPSGYLPVMFWAGLRGAIAVALALALPPTLAQRDLLTGAVYGIVLVTLVVQGTTAGWVVRRSGVLDEPSPAT